MKTDIQIAQEAQLWPITEVAKKLDKVLMGSEEFEQLLEEII